MLPASAVGYAAVSGSPCTASFQPNSLAGCSHGLQGLLKASLRLTCRSHPECHLLGTMQCIRLLSGLQVLQHASFTLMACCTPDMPP